MSLLRSPRQRWWLLALLWTLLLVLGIGGFIQQANDLGTSTSVLDNLYFTLQLAALSYEGDSEAINWRLQVARFVAPVIAASTLLQSASVVFREQFARFRARRAKRHTIVCGLGPMGVRLATVLADGGRQVVAIESDPASPGVATATDLDIPVIIGDPTDSTVLLAARADRAAQIVAASESDGVNAAITAAARGVERSSGLPPLRCAVHLADAELAHLLRSTELQHADGPRLEFFSCQATAASTLLDEHFSPAAPAPHLAVLGLGRFGRSVVLSAARTYADRDAGALRVTLVDRVATGRFHSMRMQHPALAAAVDVTCVDLDLGEPTADAVDAFERILTLEPPTLVLVAFEDEALAWSSGLFVRNRVGAASAIVIRTESDGGLTGLLDGTVPEHTGVAPLTTFPVLAKAVSLDLIDGGVREQIARALHEGHIQRSGNGGALHLPWAQLDDADRESSRAAADAIVETLATIGCRPAPLRRWGAPETVFSDAEIDQLAGLEHERWRAERAASGWRYGPVRDDAAKLNPLLVPWADVPPEARTYNLETAAELPELLARAGFDVVRS